MQEMARVLSAGGAICISVPYAMYWKAVAFPRAHHFFHPAAHAREHFVYFTKRSLRLLLEDTGFEDVHFGRARFLSKAVRDGRWPLVSEVTRFCASLVYDFIRADEFGNEIVAVARRRASD